MREKYQLRSSFSLDFLTCRSKMCLLTIKSKILVMMIHSLTILLLESVANKLICLISRFPLTNKNCLVVTDAECLLTLVNASNKHFSKCKKCTQSWYNYYGILQTDAATYYQSAMHADTLIGWGFPSFLLRIQIM